MTDAFAIRRDGPVARVTLTRPAQRNALRPQELHDLADALACLGVDDAVRLIILTGEGDRAFCAGLNLKDRAAMTAELTGTGTTGLGTVMRVAREMETPILGRINGACVAGGMGLLSACRHAVAVDTASFALPEVNVGLYPHVVLAGWSDRLAPGTLDRMADTGQAIDADAARALGLVNEVAAPEDFEDAVQRAAQQILTDVQRFRPLDAAAMNTALTTAEARTRAHHAAQIVNC